MKLVKLLMVSFIAMAIFSCTPSVQGDAAETGDATDTADATAAAKTFNADLTSSLVNWEGTKPGGAHLGTLNLKSGSVSINNGNIEAGEFVLDMTSMKCIDESLPDDMKTKLVGHLSSPDFFDAEKFPVGATVITILKYFSAISRLSYRPSNARVKYIWSQGLDPMHREINSSCFLTSV